MDLSNENIIHIKKDNVEYIQFRKLLEYKNIDHCYTLKSDGKLNFRSENNATMLKSYENISRELGFTNIIKPKQTHSDNITIIENNEKNLNEIDGLITNEKNVTLGTTKDIIFCICPSIRKCHFEVDEDLKEMFYNKYGDLPEINDIISENTAKHKYYIDTVLINKCLLKQIGLRKENIIDSNICTVCNSNLFHSYRVDKENSGRNMAIIEIK